jgi:hypothetical protein
LWRRSSSWTTSFDSPVSIPVPSDDFPGPRVRSRGYRRAELAPLAAVRGAGDGARRGSGRRWGPPALRGNRDRGDRAQPQRRRHLGPPGSGAGRLPHPGSGDRPERSGGGTRPGLAFRGDGLPPNGTNDFAFDPRQAGVLYTATDRGLFKTLDGGLSWTRLSRGIPTGEAVYSVAVDPVLPRVVYAGLRGRVYRSLNAGRTWQLLGDGLPADAEILDLLASAGDPHRLYAVAAGYGLFVQDPAAP